VAENDYSGQMFENKPKRLHQSAFKMILCRSLHFFDYTHRNLSNRHILHTEKLKFYKLCELLTSKFAEEVSGLSGSIELDESYFGGSRIVKTRHDAAKKILVCELL